MRSTAYSSARPACWPLALMIVLTSLAGCASSGPQAAPRVVAIETACPRPVEIDIRRLPPPPPPGWFRSRVETLILIDSTSPPNSP